MRRIAALTATAATAAGVLIAVPATSSASPGTPPPNPSDGQISAAQQRKQELANQVGALGGKIAQAQAELQALEGRRELAEQKVALAVSQLRDAQAAAAQARVHVQQASQSVDQAHNRFVQYLQASYMDGGADGTSSLLTATDPSSLLDESSLQQYQAQNKLDAIGNLERATVVKSNAEAAARAAVQNIAAKAAAAKRAKQAADDAVSSQQAEEASLKSTLASSQDALSKAQSTLATLNHQRAAYIAYKKEQARLARIAARKAERERERRIAARRAARQAAREAAARQAARQAAARRRAEAHAHHGGGGAVTHHQHPQSAGNRWIARGSGHWTPAEAATAVRRVRSTLGTPYAWAGGNSYGPTYGVCDPSNGAPYDCHVYGYDCSGLMMYGWGPYLSMAHYAASQYVAAGSYHPSPGNLRPGDLVFWSYNGTIGGIHHVAMYIGGGRIIEAPYSGGYIRVASLWEYGSIFGATRPLT